MFVKNDIIPNFCKFNIHFLGIWVAVISMSAQHLSLWWCVEEDTLLICYNSLSYVFCLEHILSCIICIYLYINLETLVICCLSGGTKSSPEPMLTYSQLDLGGIDI